MANNLSEEREALYQMICSLKSEDIQKVVSYVSFLRFVDVYKDKAMADLLKIELAKGDHSKPALDDTLNDTFDAYVSPPFIEDVPSYEKLKDEFYEPLINEVAEVADEPEETVAASSPGVEPIFFERDDGFYAPVRSDYFDSNKRPVSRALFFDEFALEPAQPELIQPESTRSEPISKDSGFAWEPFLQTPPPSQEPYGQRLKQVVKSLHLNFADVVFLFGVSFSMVQKWFAGAALGVEEEMQLQYLLEMAKRVEAMNIPRLDRIIRHSMPDGEFFMEKLKDRKITDENLKTLQETAERSEELRRKFKGATKPFYAMQNVVGLYATPLHCEG